jgi:hypothetical protein
MQAALLYALEGSPDNGPVESKLDGQLPAVEAQATAYLDGLQLSHGRAAARIHDERQLPMPTTSGIETEQMEVSRKALVDFYADLEGGWAGISSADGEWFVEEWLLTQHSVAAHEMALDLEAWINDFVEESDPEVWGVSYSVEVDGEATRAGADFHRDADLSQLMRDADSISGVGFRYDWSGGTVRGVIYESGYVALYSQYTEAAFGRWLADHVIPYSDSDVNAAADTTQTTLGETVGDGSGAATTEAER